MSTAARTSRRGFTLIEMLCAMVVIGLIATLAAGFVIQASSSFTVAGTGAQVLLEANSAMDRISRELRGIQLSSGSLNVSSISSSSISYNSGSSITLNSGTLSLTTPTSGSSPLAVGVTSFTLEALDNQGTLLTLPLASPATSTIQRLRITVTLTRGTTSETLRTVVFPRALITGS